jgi:DTW domain-containing protein
VSAPANAGTPVVEVCAACRKPPGICICDRVQPHATRLRVVILQHPQEDDALLGTAPLLQVTLPKCEVRVGLSWASLDHALGRAGRSRERWAVLAAAKPPVGMDPLLTPKPALLIDRKGKRLDIAHHELEGIIVLDGTWSQAKSLWWRNAWLLKLPRLLLTPREPSLYGRLRKEPRKEWVSTLEAVADVLPALGEGEAVRNDLRKLLRTLLQRARDTRAG